MTGLFALSGKIASGKDTYAQRLKEHYSPAVVRSFSAPLKSEIQLALNSPEWARGLPLPERTRELVDIVRCERDKGVAHGEHDSSSMRLLLQSWGTDFRRAEDPDYFVRKLLSRVEKDLSRGLYVVVSDCRFRNELSALRDRGAITIRLSVSEEEQRGRSAGRGSDFSAQIASHASENDLDSERFDIEIPAGLSLEDGWTHLLRELS